MVKLNVKLTAFFQVYSCMPSLDVSDHGGVGVGVFFVVVVLLTVDKNGMTFFAKEILLTYEVCLYSKYDFSHEDMKNNQ